MNIATTIQAGVVSALHALYGESVQAAYITMNLTRKEFEGDYTIVTFPFTRFARKKPPEIAAELGDYLVANLPAISRYNVVQGFLNLVVSDDFWKSFLLDAASQPGFGRQPRNGKRMMIEYCSPNTNKPLHLGHVRNILLGWSCSRIFDAAGYDVVKVQIINDRGIAICKSMLAWQLFAAGSTPAGSGVKSDHFVGDYYVLFEQKFQEEYKAWQESEPGRSVFAAQCKPEQDAADFFKAFKNHYFNDHSPLGRQAREMLQRWESGDADTLALWRKMNGWVYEGFEETFQRLGVSFDKIYYESDTYLSGKGLVEQGLASGAFYKKADGSVWVDLTDAKLDHKVLLRSDGTSVYITQDLGTARQRFEDFGAEKMVYVVADEQNYHFQVLFETLKRLGEPYADGLFHLSYGMVELPEGKMKSREGTVVDADDLIAEVIREARDATEERGEIAALPPPEQQEIFRKVGLAALKFHIIKVQPRKRMVFDPRESVDLQGHTGPHIQYAFVRINSVLRKAASTGGVPGAQASGYPGLEPQEKELVGQLYRFPEVILASAAEFDPSTVANYCYELAKSFHRFFTDLSILKAETPEARAFRLALCASVAGVLQSGMELLGIEMPERM